MKFPLKKEVDIIGAHNKYRNYATPPEARLACEVGHAAARQGITRAQANEIVNKLLSKYEDQIADAPKGKPFQEVTVHPPSPESVA